MDAPGSFSGTCIVTEQLDAVLARFGETTAKWTDETTLESMRAGLDGIFTEYPMAAKTRYWSATGAVPGEWVEVDGVAADQVMLLIHGGGFSMGSARAHRSYASHLSAACGLRVLSIDYRLAPEHMFPSAHEDCLTAWNELLDDGVKPEKIVICGDSAGGGMALALSVKLRNMKAAQPACIVLVSPWADMTASGQSYHDPEILDPISSRDMALGMAATYLGEADPSDPAASPTHAKLHDLPAVIIVAGSREVFLDDARSIERSISAAGGKAILKIWPNMIHQFPLHVSALDEAEAAIHEIGFFVTERIG